MPSQEELERMAQKMTEAQRKILESIPKAGAEEAPAQEAPIEEACRFLRVIIKDAGASTRRLMAHTVFANQQLTGVDYGEMKANIMLAYRHLEDARMRLGKVIQAYDGGTSVYDK